MEVKGTSLTMTRGDSESIAVTLTGYTAAAGDCIEMTARDLSGKIVLYKKVDSFVENRAVIDILPDDTKGLKFGNYEYDIQLQFGGAVKTIIKPSRLTIGREVTYDY